MTLFSAVDLDLYESKNHQHPVKGHSRGLAGSAPQPAPLPHTSSPLPSPHSLCSSATYS